jgi:uncharacterized protein (DUF1800 family)
MDRRAFFKQGALVGIGAGMALAGGTGCGMLNLKDRAQQLVPLTPAHWTPLPHDADLVTRAAHILNRVAYGPRPGDVAAVAQMGIAAYIETQLAEHRYRPPAAPLPEERRTPAPGDHKPLRQAATVAGSVLKTSSWLGDPDEDPALNWRVNGLDVVQAERDAPDTLDIISDDQLLGELEQAALLRATYSRRQLREVMADFWTNHFNIYALKNSGREMVPVDTERVLRPHVLGRFHDLLIASAHSPAMLAYLDNNLNRSGPGANVNENYARELLELHTLGVKSGYTQRDIHEVARCFTGWTVNTGFHKGEFLYQPEGHDNGAKYIPFLDLHLVPNRGQRDADDVLEALARHPATARFVARKLCLRFLGYAPDSAVEKAADAYLRSDSDIRATLRPILLDALPDPAQNRPILKRPLDVTVSALRALAADTDGGPDLQKYLVAMGQPLYQWPMPDGFPEKSTAWIGSLLPRWNYALALASNAIAGTRVDLEAPLKAEAGAHGDAAMLDILLETVYGRSHDAADLRPVRAQVAAHIERARRDGVPQATVVAETTALLLAAPPFQWK